MASNKNILTQAVIDAEARAYFDEHAADVKAPITVLGHKVTLDARPVGATVSDYRAALRAVEGGTRVSAPREKVLGNMLAGGARGEMTGAQLDGFAQLAEQLHKRMAGAALASDKAPRVRKQSAAERRANAAPATNGQTNGAH